MILKDLGEFNFISRMARQIKLSNRVLKGIGDDTSVLRWTKDRYLLFTCDMLIEDVHFDRKVGGYLIGEKSLSVNVSDIIVMGGVPTFAVVSLGLLPSLDIEYCDGLYRGIRKVANRFKIDIVGGDTVKSEKIVINIALLGEVEKEQLVLRSGARDGDAIFVTGLIGGSLKGRHLNFTPRLEEARFLVKNFNIHSMIDISDGLIADIGHILECSKVGAVIYEKDIPISKHAKDFNSAIKDGEDFEILWTISERDGNRLMDIWPFRTRISRIGEICKNKGLYMVKKDSRKYRIKPEGYVHF